MTMPRTFAWFSVVLGAMSASAQSFYDTAVLRDRPALYWKMASAAGASIEADVTGQGHPGRYFPSTRLPGKTTMPNGDVATVFDGVSQFLEAPSAANFSIPATGGWTLEAWIRPDTLNFAHEESDGYVHWAGKGEANAQEFACRMYSKQSEAGRPNRISGYVFNPSGHLGSGSYFQDPISVGVWMHIAVVVVRSTDTVSIYKNGVLRDTTPLSQFNVVPQPGNAPLRVATRDLNSFFKGAIGKFAIYRRALSASKLHAHYTFMR